MTTISLGTSNRVVNENPSPSKSKSPNRLRTLSVADEQQLLVALDMNKTTIPQWQSFLFSSASATIAAPFTNPFAVAKTQLQVQRNDVCITGRPKLRGMVGFFRHVIGSGNASSSSVSSLQRGLLPVMMRESSMNLFRIGLYQPIMSQICTDKEVASAPVLKRMVAGAISGAIGSFICNPFEIIRIKIQAQSLDSSPITPRTMSSNILKEEGILGFYKAGGMSVVLGMVCTSVNLTSYTLLHEEAINNLGYKDGPLVDSVCALSSGFLAAVAMNPFDVIRTRLMTQSSSSPMYRNAFHCGAVIMKTEGFAAFFKGFVPSFLRIGPHFVLTFLLLEQMRRAAQGYNNQCERYNYLHNIFRRIDRDSSGEIDEDELYSAIQEIGLADGKDITKQIFDIADVDKSGTIDLDEFMQAANSSHLYTIIRRHRLLSVFRTLDLDSSGTISHTELYNAFSLSRRKGLHQSTGSISELDREVRNVINDIDKDGDGEIDFSEFLLAVDHINELNQKHLLKDLVRNSGVSY